MRKNRRSKGIPLVFSYEEDTEDYYDDDIFGMSPIQASTSYQSHQHHHLLTSDWYNVKPLKPRNPSQTRYLDALNNAKSHVVVAAGSAGTGKTFVANSFAMEKLKKGDYTKVILTRPMISVDDKQSFGALPGDIQAKMLPYLLPIYDILHRYVSTSKLQSMISKGMIEICSLIHMRGRSFENALIIADEMQNATQSQMLMLLTRIGDNSKLVINGDPMQHDRDSHEINGLTDLICRLERFPQEGIEVIRFTDEDVERHPIIKKVLRLYNQPSSHHHSHKSKENEK